MTPRILCLTVPLPLWLAPAVPGRSPASSLCLSSGLGLCLTHRWTHRPTPMTGCPSGVAGHGAGRSLWRARLCLIRRDKECGARVTCEAPARGELVNCPFSSSPFFWGLTVGPRGLQWQGVGCEALEPSAGLEPAGISLATYPRLRPAPRGPSRGADPLEGPTGPSGLRVMSVAIGDHFPRTPKEERRVFRHWSCLSMAELLALAVGWPCALQGVKQHPWPPPTRCSGAPTQATTRHTSRRCQRPLEANIILHWARGRRLGSGLLWPGSSIPSGRSEQFPLFLSQRADLMGSVPCFADSPALTASGLAMWGVPDDLPWDLVCKSRRFSFLLSWRQKSSTSFLAWLGQPFHSELRARRALLP